MRQGINGKYIKYLSGTRIITTNVRNKHYEKSRNVITAVDFRHVVDQLAGYSKAVQNFTHVLVRNAGHMVPYDQPKWAFDMISRWISGKDFK